MNEETLHGITKSVKSDTDRYEQYHNLSHANHHIMIHNRHNHDDQGERFESLVWLLPSGEEAASMAEQGELQLQVILMMMMVKMMMTMMMQ